MTDKILTANKIITTPPTLTTSSNNTNDESGLYVSTDTNTGDPTYYFRGNVENNYVSFAGFTWRIVRINEDGTIRIIMQDGINNNTTYKFNSNTQNYSYMYYTNSEVKPIIEKWYQENIGNKSDLAKNIANGNYYCEQSKVKASSNYTSGSTNSVTYNSYKPNFKCKIDANGKGIVNSSIGLLTYDEIIHAGGYYGKLNSNYYLYNLLFNWWTMSPVGFNNSNNYAFIWHIATTGQVSDSTVDYSDVLRPVLNMSINTLVSGNGTNSNPYIVQN